MEEEDGRVCGQAGLDRGVGGNACEGVGHGGGRECEPCAELDAIFGCQSDICRSARWTQLEVVRDSGDEIPGRP